MSSVTKLNLGGMKIKGFLVTSHILWLLIAIYHDPYLYKLIKPLLLGVKLRRSPGEAINGCPGKELLIRDYDKSKASNSFAYLVAYLSVY